MLTPQDIEIVRVQAESAAENAYAESTVGIANAYVLLLQVLAVLGVAEREKLTEATLAAIRTMPPDLAAQPGWQFAPMVQEIILKMRAKGKGA